MSQRQQDLHQARADVVATVGDLLLDDESLFIPRTKEPHRYVQVRIADDSEVPG